MPFSIQQNVCSEKTFPQTFNTFHTFMALHVQTQHLPEHQLSVYLHGNEPIRKISNATPQVPLYMDAYTSPSPGSTRVPCWWWWSYQDGLLPLVHGRSGRSTVTEKGTPLNGELQGAGSTLNISEMSLNNLQEDF